MLAPRQQVLLSFFDAALHGRKLNTSLMYLSLRRLVDWKCDPWPAHFTGCHWMLVYI